MYTQSHGIFKRKHRDFVGKQVCTCQFTVPEVKISFMLFYWVICVALIWTRRVSNYDDIFDYHLRSYTDCMAGGYRRDHDCNTLRMDFQADSIPVGEVIGFLLIGFASFSFLPVVIQFQTIKNLVKASRHH